MAGQTRGTYRSKSAGGSGIPKPPVMDFAYLKSWWTEVTRKLPHAGAGKPRPKQYLVAFNGLMYQIGAVTKTQARALLSAQLKIKVPARFIKVTEMRALKYAPPGESPQLGRARRRA